MPKTRRGEIWRFLAKQHEFYSPLPEYKPWMQKSFEELKEVSSSHQHSIFIDLGKSGLSRAEIRDCRVIVKFCDRRKEDDYENGR